MSSNYHTPHTSNQNLDSAGLNGPLGELDTAIGNIVNGITTLVLKATNFTSAQHDHKDAAGGGQLELAAIDASGASDGEVPTVSSGALTFTAPNDVPSGSGMMWFGSAVPGGWLLCDGSAVSRTTYAELFAVIGTTYGSGDGSTTFNLPDLENKFGLGASAVNARGTTGGAAEHTLTVAQLPAHDHPVWDGDFRVSSGANTNNWHFAPTGDQFSGTATAPRTGDSGSGDPHNNMPPYLAINYIIKT